MLSATRRQAKLAKKAKAQKQRVKRAAVENAARRSAEIAADDADEELNAVELVIHSMVVAAKCEELFPDRDWSREQALFVDTLACRVVNMRKLPRRDKWTKIYTRPQRAMIESRPSEYLKPWWISSLNLSWPFMDMTRKRLGAR